LRDDLLEKRELKVLTLKGKMLEKRREVRDPRRTVSNAKARLEIAKKTLAVMESWLEKERRSSTVQLEVRRHGRHGLDNSRAGQRAGGMVEVVATPPVRHMTLSRAECIRCRTKAGARLSRALRRPCNMRLGVFPSTTTITITEPGSPS
jgi:hypothetical protein